MNGMIRRSVQILNDQKMHDVTPGLFEVCGHGFDIGPGLGITKGEYREFSNRMGGEDVKYGDFPERFKKFEVAEGN